MPSMPHELKQALSRRVVIDDRSDIAVSVRALEQQSKSW